MVSSSDSQRCDPALLLAAAVVVDRCPTEMHRKWYAKVVHEMVREKIESECIAGACARGTFSFPALASVGYPRIFGIAADFPMVIDFRVPSPFLLFGQYSLVHMILS
jgi:hypothetical protein